MFTRYELVNLFKEILLSNTSIDENEADEASNALVDFCVEEIGVELDEDYPDEDME